jgi:DNA adenine methylase
VSYFVGSKAQAGVFQRIIGQMPPHSVYVEAFFGSGQVFWRKRRAERSIIIDLLPGGIAKAGAEAGVNAMVGDAISLLPKLALPAGAVLYCDPPYLLSTRKGRIYYEHEMNEDQHASLLALLQELDCRVLLSGYPSELYSSQLQGWRCITYRTRTRGKTVTECLWCNFPEPQELHDWRFAGKNFRQRLTWKRLATRWLARLDRMPARKRGFVLDAVHQRWNQRWSPASDSALGPARPPASVLALRSLAPDLALTAGTTAQNCAAASGVTSAL